MLDKIFLNDNITFGDFRKTVKSQVTFLKKIIPKKVILSGEDIYIFLVNLYACICLKIPVVLIPDKSKLQYTEGVFINEIFNEDELSPITGARSDYVIEFLTSGTTGEPKTIKKTIRNLLDEAKDIKETFDLSSVSQFLTSSTLAHLFGFTFCLMTPLVLGKPINTKRISFPEQIETKDTGFISTPSFLSRMVKYSVLPPEMPAVIISAGSKLHDTDFAFLEKITNVIEIYGSTETGVIAHRESSIENLKLFKNVKIKGEKISSPYMYEDELELCDSIKLLSDGIKVYSRIDKIIKIKEERVSLTELENVLNTYLKDSCCFQIDDKLACAGVLADPGEFINKGAKKFIQELRENLKDKINIIPQKWKFVDEIPKNALGKTDTEYLKSLFEVKLSLPLVLDRKNDRLRLVFHRDSNYFKGHFNEYPIVPGVVQLYFASFFVTRLYGLKIDIGQLKKIKFSNIIKPDKELGLIFEKSDNYILYKYKDNDTVYSSGQFPMTNVFDKE